MERTELILVTLALLSLALWLSWIYTYGLKRGSLAALCRVAWILPLALAFMPEERGEEIPRTLSLKSISVFLDDSESMKQNNITSGASFSASADSIVSALSKECQRLGCRTKVTRLSELSPKVKEGYSPLAQSLDAWFYGVGGDPWVILSDGGESDPSKNWDNHLKKVGLGARDKKRGLIVGFKPEHYSNMWLEMSDAPLFAFEEKPFELNVALKREKDELQPESTQIQVISGEKILATSDVSFLKDQKEVNVVIPVRALARGQHLITVKALPTSDDMIAFDNRLQKVTEVMPNTVGVLHLLGAPSWDGRFLRRYLKSEPKYDLISFFILRDPGDIQAVSERELSLIPFPVDRLFNEELPNFHAVMLQNFTLFQFLEPNYQANLVRFVQEGGGLIFLGGPRALNLQDYANTPLASILPFESDAIAKGQMATDNFLMGLRAPSSDRSGPWYDEDLSFKIELASPTQEERALANVYDEWEGLKEQLGSQAELRGMHHMENVSFKKGSVTPLLNARLNNGKVVPLAVASYPGKGRALWIFSDSLWRLAMNPSIVSSREVYSDFMRSSLNWVLRQELTKPLLMRDFHLSQLSGGGILWQLKVFGPAAKYVHNEGEWSYSICGTAVPHESVAAVREGGDSWTLSGELDLTLTSGSYCQADIKGQHPAFGSVRASLPTTLYELYSDQEVPAAPQRLSQLAKITGAELISEEATSSLKALEWLGEATGQAGIALPQRTKTIRDYFWVLSRPWVFLLLFAIPIEIIIRRWPELSSDRRWSDHNSGWVGRWL